MVRLRQHTLKQRQEFAIAVCSQNGRFDYSGPVKIHLQCSSSDFVNHTQVLLGIANDTAASDFSASNLKLA